MAIIEQQEATAPIEATTEAPQETKAEAKPDAEAQRLNQMARREKILVHRSRELKQREEALKQREESVKAPEPSFDWKAELQKNPLKVLEDAGLPYDQLVQRLLNEDPMNHNMAKLYEKIAAIEAGQKSVTQRMEDQQKQNYDQAIKQVKVEVKQALTQRPEDFEVLSSYGEDAQDAVVQLIEKTFETEGYVMDIETAAQEVEDYLLEKTIALAKLKKVQSKLTPTQIAAQQEVPPPKTSATPSITPRANTLTHTMNGSSRTLTSKERRERAILAFQGKLT